MLLWIAIGLAIIFSLLYNYSNGLFDTALWIAKIMTPQGYENIQEAKLLLRKNQAILMVGWPSDFPFYTYLFAITSIVLGFIDIWWVGFIMIFVIAFLGSIARFFFIRPVSYYLTIYLERMVNRCEYCRQKRELETAAAYKIFSDDLKKVLSIYSNSKIKVPTPKQISANPYGDVFFLLDLYK